MAMTRHRDDLAVFVDRSALPNYADATMNIDRRGLIDPEQPLDDRSDMEIAAAIGRSMERATAPRNALDVLGLPPSMPKWPVSFRGQKPSGHPATIDALPPELGPEKPYQVQDGPVP